jgi:hypothetical protein
VPRQDPAPATSSLPTVVPVLEETVENTVGTVEEVVADPVGTVEDVVQDPVGTVTGVVGGILPPPAKPKKPLLPGLGG